MSLFEPMPFQMADHVDPTSWPEWGAAPRGPLVAFDMAHRGEWMGSAIGADAATGEPMVYQIVRCEMCNGTHIWPIPDEEALTQFYAREFYDTAKPTMIADYEQDAAWWEHCMHGPVLDSAVAALGTTVDDAPRILDVGAGPGLLLRVARERGCWTHAIEPSPLCAERLRKGGHVVWEGSLRTYMESRSIRRNDYDIVTMWETLEHMSCPEQALDDVYALLKPGGVVAVCVPNDYAPGQLEACRRFRLPRWWVSAPQHVWMFSPKTLQLLLRRCGFRQYEMRMTFPMVEKFMLEQGRCYVGDPVLGKACHQERMAFEMETVKRGRWADLESRYAANVAQRVGREIVAIFQKPY